MAVVILRAVPYIHIMKRYSKDRIFPRAVTVVVMKAVPYLCVMKMYFNGQKGHNLEIGF
jgi:hypothetical protein